MNIFFSSEVNKDEIILGEEEAHHCNHVLRLPEKSIVGVIDGKGNLFECLLIENRKKNCKLEIIKREFFKPDPCQVHIAIAPTKSSDKIEWFIEKSTELGIREITFIQCERSERKIMNMERASRIMISALKQSHNMYLPVVHPVIKYNSFIESRKSYDNKFIANISEETKDTLLDAATPADNNTLLIGPEGDFTENEVKLAVNNGFRPVSLGKSRLRTETAGLVGLHTLLMISQLKK
jgi:16S rRNA (uracil1498-N3)-methyltransferase